MAAEPLPFSFGTLSSWELEAWYEDLQEVLSSEENRGTYAPPPETEQEEPKSFTTLDPASLVWLAEEPGPGGVTGSGQSPCSPESSQSSLAQEEEEEQGERGRNRKRRHSEQRPARGRKRSAREREHENERQAARLAAENERLQREIQRLTEEVGVARQALIDRMVSLPRP